MKVRYRLLLAAALALLASGTAYADGMGKMGMMDMPGHEAKMGMGHMGHEFAHPFLAHMGVPDEPGMISVRATGYRSLYGDTASGDFALHVEAGIVRRLGLHVRSDGILHEPYSEVMLQFAPLLTPDNENGLSVYAEANLPTGPGASGVQGRAGLSGRLTWPGVVVFDANGNYDPFNASAEFEGSLVFKATEWFFPLVEAEAEYDEASLVANLLAGLKFRLTSHTNVGVAYSLPLLAQREYDSRALLTFDIAF